jgi:hypothetical protein
MISGNRLLLGLALVTNAGCASAQPVKPIDPVRFDPLHLPGAKFMCRPRPLPETAPPKFIHFEFEDGELMINDRFIAAVYDPLGGPRLLIVNAAEEVKDGPPVAHVFSVAFPDDSPAIGFHLVAPPGVDDRTVPREALSPAMITKSRDLMTWLWNHRCGKIPTG